MKEPNVERLLGHAGNWSNAAYDRPLEDWLIEEYLKAVPDLTIYKPNKIAEQTQELASRVESKDKEMEKRLEDMEHQLSEMVKFFGQKLAFVGPLTDNEKQRLGELQKQIDQMNQEGVGLE